MKNPTKFASQEGSSFHRAIRNGVNGYFKKQGISKHATGGVWFKNSFMLALYFVPYVLFLAFFHDSTAGILLLYGIMGLGMAGIGMNVAHDANHGATSSKRSTNQFLGSMLYFIGVDRDLWKQEHNVEHHTFTNIEGLDTDISVPFLLRFSPQQQLRKIHRYQYIYAWLLYGLITLRWATIGDFARTIKNHKENQTPKSALYKDLLKLAGWKLFYHGYLWVLPIFILPVSPLTMLLAFLTLQAVAGFILGIIFQTAHIMPKAAFPDPGPENRIASHWAVHQMETTCNYAAKGTIFSWFVGGLNYQIEHHLFPNISHQHYPRISKIIQELAREHGVPYNTYKTFFAAVHAHGLHLWELGRRNGTAKMAV